MYDVYRRSASIGVENFHRILSLSGHIGTRQCP